MRVLMLTHEYPPLGGGAGVALLHLANGLVGLGHAVRVLTIGDSEQRQMSGGIEVERFRASANSNRLAGLTTWLSFLTAAPRHVRRAAAEFRPDVINAHFVFPAAFVVARSGLTIPHVASIVGADIHDPTRRVSADNNLLVRWASRQALRHAEAVTSPSADLTDRTRALFPDAKLATIPWGVPPVGCAEAGVGNLDLPDDAFVVATVCRLVRRKRVDRLIQAVADLNAAEPSGRPVILVIIGSGPAEADLRQQAAQLGIAQQVRFPGRVSDADKDAYLHRADVFCLASEHEGFGLVYIEAMSAGTPAIAASVGGQTDIIRDGVDGFLAPTGDAAALGRHLASLRDDDARLRAMKDAARQRAADFAPDKTAAAFADLYQRSIRA